MISTLLSLSTGAPFICTSEKSAEIYTMSNEMIKREQFNTAQFQKSYVAQYLMHVVYE